MHNAVSTVQGIWATSHIQIMKKEDNERLLIQIYFDEKIVLS